MKENISIINGGISNGQWQRISVSAAAYGNIRQQLSMAIAAIMAYQCGGEAYQHGGGEKKAIEKRENINGVVVI